MQDAPSEEDFQTKLLEYIKENNLNEITSLIDGGRIDINHVYGYPYYHTALCTALKWFPENISPESIEILLNNEADPLLEEDDMNAINFAVESGNTELLKPILEFLKSNNYNFGNSTALLLLMKYIHSEGKCEENYLEIVKLLLQYGIDINKIDNQNGYTVIYLAAKHDFKNIIATILENGGVNLDNFTDEKKETARGLLSKQPLFANNLPKKMDEHNIVTRDTLFKNVRSKEVELLKINYNNLKDDLSNKDKKELVELALKQELDVCFILKDCTDIETLLEKATDRGNYKMVDFILNYLIETKHYSLDDSIVEKALICLAKVTRTSRVTDTIDYNKCLDILLSYENLQINTKDELSKKTVLHLMSLYQPSEMIMKVLRKGASLASTDFFKFTAISDIDKYTLKAHLDECIRESNYYFYTEEDRHIAIDFTTLLPESDVNILDSSSAKNNKSEGNYIDSKVNINNSSQDVRFDTKLLMSTNQNNGQQLFDSETIVLEHISKSKELRHLMLHPVIMALLHLKWNQIKSLVWANIALYSIFILCLSLFILLQNTSTIPLKKIMYIITYIICVLLTMKKVFMLRFISNILSNKTVPFEDFIETVILILTWAILNMSDKYWIREISAVLIICLGVQVLFLIGIYSLHITMLKWVAYNFFYFLLFFFALIFAYAISFYILFQQNTEGEYFDVHCEETEEEHVFVSPWNVIVKLIAMLTGELDAGNINFCNNSTTSPIIFISFIFIITIVLMNLLNSLAVYDVQMIKNDAELFYHIKKVEQLAYFEKFLFKQSLMLKFNYIKNMLCLFPNSNKKIKIYENLNYKLVFEDSGKKSTFISKNVYEVIKNQLIEMQNEKNKEDEEIKYKEEMRNHIQDLKILIKTDIQNVIKEIINQKYVLKKLCRRNKKRLVIRSKTYRVNK